MKRMLTGALILMLLALPALSETALTVNESVITVEQANAWMWLVKQSYSELTDYYEKTLGIDYWSLTYANGLTPWDSVKADAFKQLVMMSVFEGIAREEGLALSSEERALCRQTAQNADLNAGFDADDLEWALQLRLLAGKAYSYALSFTEIDEEAVTASVDREALAACEIEYLYVPFYVYDSSGEMYRKSAEELRALKGFAGDYEEAARLSPYLVYGTMTLCPADKNCDRTLLDAAAALAVGESSDLIETDYGLFVLRLLNDSDPSLYEAAVAEKLLDARKDAYRAEYNRLYASAQYDLNAEYWDTLKP